VRVFVDNTLSYNISQSDNCTQLTRLLAAPREGSYALCPIGLPAVVQARLGPRVAEAAVATVQLGAYSKRASLL
jgi:hypothetical protein